jgi:hypothetical protein
MMLYPCMDALLDEMEDFVGEYYGFDGASWRSGDFAAGALLEFKDRYDGRLHHWTVDDVSEFLLGWFPRTVLADEELQRDVPYCAVVFFRFMAARGSLTGDSLYDLQDACERLRGHFLSSCRDPRQWDPGKLRLSRIVALLPAWARRARTSGRSPAPRRTRGAAAAQTRCIAALPRCAGRGRGAR